MVRRRSRPHRKSGQGHGMKNNFIQQTDINKGAYIRSVERRYGKDGFTQDGRIKQTVIDADKKSSNTKLKKRAVLADTLRNLAKK